MIRDPMSTTDEAGPLARAIAEDVLGREGGAPPPFAYRPGSFYEPIDGDPEAEFAAGTRPFVEYLNQTQALRRQQEANERAHPEMRPTSPTTCPNGGATQHATQRAHRLVIGQRR